MWKRGGGGEGNWVFSVLWGFFPYPWEQLWVIPPKRSYSPLLKRAVVPRNRRVGERRLESSRLVCPGIRFLPINWDWQGLSVAGSRPRCSGCALAGVCWARVMLAATRVPPGQGRSEDGSVWHLRQALRGCWPALRAGLWADEVFSTASGRACFLYAVRLFSQQFLAIKT